MFLQHVRPSAASRIFVTILALALLIGLQAQTTKGAQASEVALYYEYFCSRTPGLVGLELRWPGVGPDAREVWIDVSDYDNTWTGAYLSTGYVAGTGHVVEWDGFQPATTYYFRISQLLANGTWDTGPTFEITTVSCGGPAAPALPAETVPPATNESP